MKFVPRSLVASSIVALFALVAMVLMQAYSGQYLVEAAKGGQTKVGMCHREGNGTYHPIRVAEPAVPAHLAHGDATLGGTCSEGVGECAKDGTLVCSESGAVCDAVPGEPSSEVCNTLDDDCDGVVDEDIPSTPTTCGVGACGATGATSCVAGALVDSCTPGTPSAEVCDNLDNNCNGAVDEGIPSTPTSCGTGVCAAAGAMSCVGGVFVNSCTPGPSSPEVCDNLDNNCNGSTDEGLGTISCGTGICQNSVNTCISGVIQVCTPLPAGDEGLICNTLDDNCNGTVDEGLSC